MRQCDQDRKALNEGEKIEDLYNLYERLEVASQYLCRGAISFRTSGCFFSGLCNFAEPIRGLITFFSFSRSTCRNSSRSRSSSFLVAR